jgi:hypothetical protein
MVFPVSLSEIAFILVFVLMLLLGYMLMQERQFKEQAQAKLAKVHRTQSAEAATQAMQRAQQNLTEALESGGVSNPAEVVQVALNAGETAAERDRLRQDVLDLTKKLVALEDLRSEIEQAGKSKDDQVTREQLEDALVLQQEVKNLADEASKKNVDLQQAIERVKQAIAATNELRTQAKEKLGININPGQEPQVVRDVVEGARIAAAARSDNNSPEAIKSENNKLKSQVAFYEKRDKLRGLDHPPCWMDKDSKIEYIFNVQTTPAGFVVTRGWAANRELDAKATQGFDTIMANSGLPMNAEQFTQGAKHYLNYGKKQSPECRHFVYLSSTITEANRRDDARRMVNSFFYILERRSPVML